jgi:hypothetical protein
MLLPHSYKKDTDNEHWMKKPWIDYTAAAFEVGDVVRYTFPANHSSKINVSSKRSSTKSSMKYEMGNNNNNEYQEGLVVEHINDFKIRVDFGNCIRECLIDHCTLITKAMEFEEGDKVEIKPVGLHLYFVGKIIKIHEDKSMNIKMETDDDVEDIEYHVLPENTRKIMSRRALVVNRWKKAFMLVLAANFFRRIEFDYSDTHSTLAASDNGHENITTTTTTTTDK